MTEPVEIDVLKQLQQYARPGIIQPKLIRVVRNAMNEIEKLRSELKKIKEEVE